MCVSTRQWRLASSGLREVSRRSLGGLVRAACGQSQRGLTVESIDNLIDTLEILCSALSARDKNKALESIAPLFEQFTAMFGRASRIFLGILFLETLKVHILCEEFEEASGGAGAFLARLRAVNAVLKQSAAQSAPTNSDAYRVDLLDDVMTAEIAPRPALPLSGGSGARGWDGWRRYDITVKYLRRLPAYRAGAPE